MTNIIISSNASTIFSKLKLKKQIFAPIIFETICIEATQRRPMEQKLEIRVWKNNLHPIFPPFIIAFMGQIKIFKFLVSNVFWQNSMTSLLMHTVAHSTRPSSRPKINNQPHKKFLSLAVSWVKVLKIRRHFRKLVV